MFNILWDKGQIEKNICTGAGEHFVLDFYAPIQIFINDVEITGHKELPERISNFWGLFLNFIFVFKSIDPEKLGDKELCFSSNIKDEVSGDGFNFYVGLDKATDLLAIRYSNYVISKYCTIPNGYRTLQIPLRDFAEGVLRSSRDMLDFILKVAPQQEGDDTYLCLKNGTQIIQDWYHERYGNK